MNCPKCGTPNDDKAAKCAKCQTELKRADALESYQAIAETVGGLPSLNVKDNLYQGLAVGVGTVLGALIGLVIGGWQGALFGALIGLVGMGLISGFVLMILGFTRRMKKK